jgi:hypothetical protein
LLKRQEYKDLIDIIELISHPKISLEDGLKCFFALHYHKFQESKDKYQNMCLEFKNICLSDKSKDLIRNNSLYDILKIQAKKIDVNNVIKAINTIKIYDDLSGHVIDKSPHHKPRF